MIEMPDKNLRETAASRTGRARRHFPVIATVLILAGAVAYSVIGHDSARAAGSDGSNDRYELMRDGDDFIRMDRETGVMSLCRRVNGQLVCELAADDRDAMQEEFDTLMERIDRLEARRDGTEDGWSHDDNMEDFDRELDRVLDYSKRTLKRFNGFMRDLRRDYHGYE